MPTAATKSSTTAKKIAEAAAKNVAETAKTAKTKPQPAKPTPKTAKPSAPGVSDIIARDATVNEEAMYQWACEQSGVKLDRVSFIAGRRLQAHWQAYNRANR